MEEADDFTLPCLWLLQVHGVVNDTIAFVQNVISTELNSATDNPVSYRNSSLCYPSLSVRAVTENEGTNV